MKADVSDADSLKVFSAQIGGGTAAQYIVSHEDFLSSVLHSYYTTGRIFVQAKSVDEYLHFGNRYCLSFVTTLRYHILASRENSP
jgi:hypothetical protein